MFSGGGRLTPDALSGPLPAFIMPSYATGIAKNLGAGPGRLGPCLFFLLTRSIRTLATEREMIDNWPPVFQLSY